MGTYSTLTNQPIDIHLNEDWYDTGWSISGGKAIHVSCNEGIIKNNTMPTESGETYKVVFTVSGYSSGTVYPILGGVNGTPVSANGTYEQEIEAGDDTGLKFWSDGDLEVQLVRVANGTVPAVTLSFNKEQLRWIGYWSYAPDFMSEFLDGYYSWKDGQLWAHDENPIRNSFYGDEYPSVITFYCNVNYDQDKDYYSLTLNGVTPWRADIELPPRKGKSNGQVSRLKTGRFEMEKGKFVAAFLRDMNDPRFTDPLQALMNGAYLQGQYMKITLTHDKDEDVHLVTAEVDVTVK